MMYAQIFLANFTAIAESRDGVQRLRKLVLDLAVRGQLTSSNEGDDKIDELFVSIYLARESMIANGVIGKPRYPEGVSATAVPYDIPSTWRWVRLGDVGAIVGGGTPKSEVTRYWAEGEDIPWLTPADMRAQQSRFVRRGARDITPDGLAESSAQLLPAGSILFSSRAPIGYVSIAELPLTTNQGFKSCVPYVDAMSDYLYVFLRQVAPSVDGAATGTTFREVSGKDVALIPVPVPPLAEQKRIVTKVNELTNLCEQVEAQQIRHVQATTRLRGSMLHALTEAYTLEELRRAWERISTNWSALIDCADGIGELRRVILQLAVEGRLSRSELGGESAAQLVRRCETERWVLAQQGTIGKPKGRVPVDKGRLPFMLPPSWEWVHVEDVCTHIVDCLHRTPKYVSDGYPAIRTCDVVPGRVLVDQALRVDEGTYREQISRLTPEAGDIVYSREGGRFGIAAIVPPGVTLCLSQRMMQFRCCSGISPEYFTWFLNSPLGFGQAQLDVGGSASPHVNIGSIKRFIFPLPPESEQYRIVVTINHLWSLCDDLERVMGKLSLRQNAVSAALTNFP
jgi:type I restriction enzyme S subunit